MSAKEIAAKLAEHICQGEDRVRLGEPNKFNGSQPGWGKTVLCDLIEDAIMKREREVIQQFSACLMLRINR